MAQSAWDIPNLNRKIFLFHYQIFFVINFSYFVIRFLLNNSIPIVKSDNKIGKVNEKKIRLKNLIIGKKVITDRLDLCVTSFVGSLELLESEQEKAESDCAIHQNQCSQSSLTRNNYPSPLHQPSLPQKITSGGCINKVVFSWNL